MEGIEMSQQFLYSDIQGNVSRSEQLAELTLTETFYPARLRLSPHAHAQACFGLILAGEYEEAFRLKALSCRPHSILFRPPQVVHSNHVCEKGARCFFIEIPPQWLETLPERGARLREPAVLEGGQLEWLARRLYQEWRAMDEASSLIVHGLALEMLGHFQRGWQAKAELRPPAWLRQTQELLRARFAEPLPLAEIARHVNLHPAHVAREFRRYYRTSIGEFQRQQRIEFAREQLTNSNAPLSEIALAAGFAQQAHFTTVFKRLTGQTPAQYRTLTRGGRDQ